MEREFVFVLGVEYKHVIRWKQDTPQLGSVNIQPDVSLITQM